MAAKLSPYRVAVLSERERARIAALAEAAGLSVSNWFRQSAGLPLVDHGGHRERQQPATNHTSKPK
jgi:hypothetical protein